MHRRNLLHCFHQEAKNQKTNSRVLFFKHADPSNLGRFLLEGKKNHWLSQARSELMKQERQVGSLNAHNTDMLRFDENKFVHMKNYL